MEDVFRVLGGLGLFLLGMSVMSDGLRGLAGRALRRALGSYTRSPTSGAIVGATSTAIIQSSSATAAAAIGFVSAGLLTFSQSLGIVFGANIGTTATGWIVVLFGFKLDLKIALLPVILVGTMFRLFGKGKMQHGGLALAGFGLIFVGIGFLQAGLAGAATHVTPDSFPPDTMFGRVLLVLIGVAVTLATQSSSAGVAMALTALHAGAINFSQAAAMVIGMDMGTTVTALIAAVGRNAPARRLAYAHVIYNVLTGIGAFILLSPYTLALEGMSDGVTGREPMLCLVGFHTFFNALGVIVVLPFARRFGDWITRLVPERGPRLTQRLDPRLVHEPAIALEAVAATLRTIAQRAFAEASSLAHGGEGGDRSRERLDELKDALARTRQFLSELNMSTEERGGRRRHMEAMHVVDHLRRLVRRAGRTAAVTAVHETTELDAVRLALIEALTQAHDGLRRGQLEGAISTANELAKSMRKHHAERRRAVLEAAASGSLDADASLHSMDALRWLERVAHHVRRILFHLGRSSSATKPERDGLSGG